MEKLPENIEIFSSSIGDFGNCAIVFEEINKEILFKIVADEEWYLSSDGKFYEDEEKAALYPKDAIKDGKVIKAYPSIRHRAFEAIAFVMHGRFPKVSV